MYEMTYGTKYEATKGLDKAEVAKLIRADIKAAVKAGELPKATYSVRLSRYSGGASINVSVTGWAGPHYALRPDFGGWGVKRHPAEVALEKKLEAIVAAYNYDGSDIATDYFNVRFYSSIRFECDNAAYLALDAVAKAVRGTNRLCPAEHGLVEVEMGNEVAFELAAPVAA